MTDVILFFNLGIENISTHRYIFNILILIFDYYFQDSC
jgi:hypothetical protein